MNVIGVLQFDMTNYQGTQAADIVFYQDYTHYFQNEFITRAGEPLRPDARRRTRA